MKDSRSDSITLNAICPYFTMFPLDVPLKHLQGLQASSWVLDPFCGRGTTNFAARLLGLPSVGVDSSPIATAIAAGKMVDVSPATITRVCRNILNETPPQEIPEGAFWRMCYHPDTLQEILKIRHALALDCTTQAKKGLLAIMLGILHGPKNKGLPSYLSNQMPRTYAAKPDYAVRFWKTNCLSPDCISVADLVARKAAYYFTQKPSSVEHKMICGDSRTIDFSAIGPKFFRVVTSPPYYGMRTYLPDQWLRHWFLGGPPDVVYYHPNQMSHSSPEAFVAQLASTWKNVSKACVPGAKMVIRFGGIHDRKANPKEILTASIRDAGGLQLSTIRSAGLSSSGKRQAEQFKRTLRKPIEEFDFHVTIGG